MFKVSLILTGFFVAIGTIVDFPFLADDYICLYKASLPEFPPIGLGTILSRVPVSAYSVWLIFKSQIFEHTWLLLYFFFFVYAYSFCLIFEQVLKDLKIKSPLTRWGSLAVFLPINYEVNLWPMCLPYIWGCLFMAIGFRTSKKSLQVLSSSLAILTLETFVLPFLAIFIWNGWRQKPERFFARALFLWFISLVIAFIVRFILGSFIGHHTMGMNLSPLHMLERIEPLFFKLWSMHFYRVNWVATALEWLSLGLLLYVLWTKNRAKLKLIFYAFLGISLTAGHTLVVGYDAARAYFGSIFLVAIFFGVLFSMLLQTRPLSIPAKLALFFFVAALTVQNTVIFLNKNHNAKVVREYKEALTQKIIECVEPCHLQVQNPSQLTKTDWVLPDFAVSPFLSWIKMKAAPTKAVEISVTN